MKLKTLEKDTLKTILNFLEWRHIFHWRNNTGALSIPESKRFIRFGQSGSPDIFAVVKGQIFGIEVKSEAGKQTDNQKEWQKDFEKAGGVYLLIKSLTELENYEIF